MVCLVEGTHRQGICLLFQEYMNKIAIHKFKALD